MATPAETSENATVGSCIIEATVPTGFEMIAAEEAKEVFNTECRSLRGKIQFETPISRVKEIVELGGIDHCRAQILHVPCFGFTSDGDECLARLCKLVKDGNWTEGLKIWSMFHSFDHHISPEPKQEMTAEELVDIVYSVYMPGHRRKPHPRDDEKNGTDKKKGGGGKRDKKRGKDKRREKKEDENKSETATENSTQESATENSVEDASTENSTQDADDVEKKTDGENEGGVAENGEEEKEQGLCEGKDVEETAPSQENRIEENGGEVATGAGGVTEAGDCASVLPVLPSAPVPTEAGDASTVDPALGTTMTQLASCTQDIPESGDAPAASEKSPPSIHISPPSSPTKNDSGSEVDAAGLDAAKEESAPECQQSEPQDLGLVNGAESSVDPAVVSSGDVAQDEMAAAGSEDEKLQTKPESEQEETPEKSEVEASAPPAKKRRDFDPTKPTFRITCKRNGDHHSFDSMSAAASFGSAVQRYFGWNVDMTNFNIEIVLNIDNNDVSFGLALTPESLHRRNVVAFGVTTLRPTICHNMLRMVKVRPGHVVCDPLCGTGSISIQGAQKFPALQLCGDNSRIAMEKTFINMDAMNKKRSAEGKGGLMMDAVKWNACHMPLRDGIVDVFVTDLPFGKRLGKKFNNTKLYRNVLDEMARVSKDGGRAALLTGDIHNMHKAIQQQKYWSRRRVYSCSIGGISACVFLLFRDRVPYVKYVRDSWRPRREPDATVADGAGPADKHVDSEGACSDESEGGDEEGEGALFGSDLEGLFGGEGGDGVGLGSPVCDDHLGPNMFERNKGAEDASKAEDDTGKVDDDDDAGKADGVESTGDAPEKQGEDSDAESSSEPPAKESDGAAKPVDGESTQSPEEGDKKKEKAAAFDRDMKRRTASDCTSFKPGSRKRTSSENNVLSGSKSPDGSKHGSKRRASSEVGRISSGDSGVSDAAISPEAESFRRASRSSKRDSAKSGEVGSVADVKPATGNILKDAELKAAQSVMHGNLSQYELMAEQASKDEETLYEKGTTDVHHHHHFHHHHHHYFHHHHHHDTPTPAPLQDESIISRGPQIALGQGKNGKENQDGGQEREGRSKGYRGYRQQRRSSKEKHTPDNKKSFAAPAGLQMPAPFTMPGGINIPVLASLARGFGDAGLQHVMQQGPGNKEGFHHGDSLHHVKHFHAQHAAGDFHYSNINVHPGNILRSPGNMNVPPGAGMLPGNAAGEHKNVPTGLLGPAPHSGKDGHQTQNPRDNKFQQGHQQGYGNRGNFRGQGQRDNFYRGGGGFHGDRGRFRDRRPYEGRFGNRDGQGQGGREGQGHGGRRGGGNGDVRLGGGRREGVGEERGGAGGHTRSDPHRDPKDGADKKW